MSVLESARPILAMFGLVGLSMAGALLVCGVIGLLGGYDGPDAW